MELSELFEVVREFDPNFDKSLFQKRLEDLGVLSKTLIDTKKFMIEGEVVSEGGVFIHEVHGSPLPDHIQNVAWQLIGGEIAERYSRNGMEVGLRPPQVYRSNDQWGYSIKADNWTKKELESGLNAVISATNDLNRKMEAEMKRLRAL